MSSTTAGFLAPSRIRCYHRPLILALLGLAILCVFWFTSRYPQLLAKSEHVGQALPSMAWGSEVVHVTADASMAERILVGALNWLAGMKIGMTFGVLFGALLHTVLRHYPLKIGRNLYLNTLKGALVGLPMGVCANCAVPAACGVTRGRGRIEVALGFLFSSPNFNPVVVVMTVSALPAAMVITKYALLLTVIVLVVPRVIGWLERNQPLQVLTTGDEACAIPSVATGCTDPFGTVLVECLRDFARNAWMLVKPTIMIMAVASLVASTMLTLIPWSTLLAEVSPVRLGLVSLISVFMPVPIALDVMFAAQLQAQGVAPGYVMLFLLTLGTFSVVPAIYLWREVSRPLAAVLFSFFLLAGWMVGLIF